jgi:hypothetical protein
MAWIRLLRLETFLAHDLHASDGPQQPVHVILGQDGALRTKAVLNAPKPSKLFLTALHQCIPGLHDKSHPP